MHSSTHVVGVVQVTHEEMHAAMEKVEQRVQSINNRASSLSKLVEGNKALINANTTAITSMDNKWACWCNVMGHWVGAQGW